MVASLWHQLLGAKVRLLVRFPARVLRGGSMRACGWGVQTTTCSGCKPIVVRGVNLQCFTSQPVLVGGSNLQWSARRPILVAPLTTIGRYYLPAVGVVTGRLALRAHLRLQPHSFRQICRVIKSFGDLLKFILPSDYRTTFLYLAGYHLLYLFVFCFGEQIF